MHKNIDAQIINSIIMSEIKTLGFQLDVYLETDIEGRVNQKVLMRNATQMLVSQKMLEL